MTATFGDFLHPAGQHIAAAVTFRGDLTDDVRCVAVRELGRLVSVLASYFDDLPLPRDVDPAAQRPASPDTQAVTDARIALRRAARSLRHGTTLTEDPHPVVRHLSAAADHLAAGRDLLQTHFTSTPSGSRTDSSYWAPTVTSRPVTAALLGEIADQARTLAPWAAQLTMTGTIGLGMPAPERLILNSAISGLWITAAAVEAAQRKHLPSEDARRLLAAIPPSFPPPRRPPDDREPVTQLCQGITITAERLRHAARAPARRSPPAMSASWRRGALAAAVTSHASEIILRTLAERASQLGTDPGIRARLHTAADAMSLAWPAWRGVACEWDILSTGTHPGPAAAADFGDLVLRTGRLAYASPHWTPACASASRIRAPADLAPTGEGIPIVLAAVHHAADAISRVGTADHQAVRTTAGLGRLYLPTRLMPDGYDIPYRYTRPAGPRSDALLAMYVTATSVSVLFSELLDDLAAAIDAPSTLLRAHRNFENMQAGARRHAGDGRAEPAAAPSAPPQAAQIERVLHSLQITEPAMVLRAVAIDQAGRDLLAEASAKSRNRDSLAASPAQPARQAARARAVSVASEDLPRRMPNRDQQPSRHDERTPALPATATPTAEAMREAAPLFGQPPSARDAPYRARPVLDAGNGETLAWTTTGPGTGPGEPGSPVAATAQERRGRQIIEALQSRARAQGRDPLGEAKQRTVLETITNLPADLIDQLVRPDTAAQGTAAELAPANRLARPWQHDFPLPVRDVVASAAGSAPATAQPAAAAPARQAVSRSHPRP